jgi:hypothetical protein
MISCVVVSERMNLISGTAGWPASGNRLLVFSSLSFFWSISRRGIVSLS